MPNDLRLRVGTAEATIPLGGTPAQIATALTRFATSLGIPTTGTPTENLTAILLHVRDDVRRRSKAAHRAELEAANKAAIEATLAADDDVIGV